MGRLHGHMYRIDKHKHTHTLFVFVFVFVFVFFNMCICTAGRQPLYIQDICFPPYKNMFCMYLFVVYVFVFFNLCICTAGSQPLYIQDICYPLYTDCLAHLNHGVGQLLRKSVCSISTLTRPTKYKYCHKCKYKLQITFKVSPLR